jgi:hypothetical protein
MWTLFSPAHVSVSCCCCHTGLRLTPGKGRGTTPHAGGSGGRRLFEVGSSSGSDGEYSGDSDDEGDDNYRPELHHLSGRGKGSMLSKRKRHGQLPGMSADKVGHGRRGDAWFVHVVLAAAASGV